LLTEAIARRLELGPGDVLLDLCCGNGQVTARLAPLCRVVVGADFSQELVATARERNSAANIAYLHRSAEDLHTADFPMGRPSKVCMNSGLQYFTEAAARRLLRMLRGMVADGASIYFSDVPDAVKLGKFYDSPARWAEFERRRAAGTEAIGTWWDRAHLLSLFASNGFACEILEPDQGRVTARYRFDLLGRLQSRLPRP
jgi:SAM-dependent methyltransferase